MSFLLPNPIFKLNRHPTLDLIVFGLYKSVLISDIKTKSTLDASTVLKTAPIFPGFSGDSKIKIIGFFFS